MTLDQAFGLVNLVPLVGWAALAFAPMRRPAMLAVARTAAVSVAVAYAMMIVAALTRPGAPVDLTTLGGLAHAFSDPRVMLVGWAHYLALDLWTGAWEADDAPASGVPHAALLPCLALTFLAGPVGLLLYLGARPLDRGLGSRRRPGFGRSARSAPALPGADLPGRSGRPPALSRRARRLASSSTAVRADPSCQARPSCVSASCTAGLAVIRSK